MSSPTALDQIRARIAADLTAAMRARDPVATAALRAALGVLDNATAIAAPACPQDGPTEVPGRLVEAPEVRRLLLAEAEERVAAAAEYARLEQPVRAARLEAEARIIRACLQHAGERADASPDTPGREP